MIASDLRQAYVTLVVFDQHLIFDLVFPSFFFCTEQKIRNKFRHNFVTCWLNIQYLV